MTIGTGAGSTVPAVSVVVPCFQNARFIERTVASVLAQTFTDFELVISDHSSTDGTWEKVQRYADDPRVRLLRTEAGGGAVRNWNRATEAAQADLVKLLCGDDLIYPECLEQQVAALRAHPSAGLVACKRDLVDIHDGTLLKGRGLRGLTGLVRGRTAVRSLVRAGTNLLGEPGCVLLSAELLRKVGGWDASYPFLIDQYTYMRALEHADLVAVDLTLAAFRVSNTQWSVHLATEQARQAAGAHRRIASDLPGVISAWDERIGTIRALRTAWARRTAYFAWRKRMRETA